jgi:hypothetical protein
VIHTIGDSHANWTFRDTTISPSTILSPIPGVSIHYLGAITMKRVGYLEDTLLPDMMKTIELQPEDTLIFCFGEIDVRCYVKGNLERLKISAHELLQDWVDRYFIRISTLDTKGAKIAIMSVVPPHINPVHKDFPVAGTIEERVMYTNKINELYNIECQKRGCLYFDVHSRYKDENERLPRAYSQGTVHITDTKFVRSLLVETGLLK